MRPTDLHNGHSVVVVVYKWTVSTYRKLHTDFVFKKNPVPILYIMYAASPSMDGFRPFLYSGRTHHCAYIVEVAVHGGVVHFCVVVARNSLEGKSVVAHP